MKKLQILAAFLCILPCCSLPAEDGQLKQKDQAIVDSFYPSELAGSAAGTFNKLTCFSRLDSRTIVAGYAYGDSAAILLLKKEEHDRYKKAFQVSGLGLSGGMCRVDSVQLSDDRRVRHEGQHQQQVIVGFATASANSMEWVFDVEEDKLVNIGPTTTYPDEKGLPVTDLSDYDLVNYFQDGTLQLVSGGEYPPPADGNGPEDGMQLYRLIDGRLKLDTRVSVIFDTKIDHASGGSYQGNFLRRLCTSSATAAWID